MIISTSREIEREREREVNWSGKNDKSGICGHLLQVKLDLYIHKANVSKNGNVFL